MKTSFSSNFHIVNALSFHVRLKEIFKDACVCCIKGVSLPDYPDIVSEQDSCGIKCPHDKTDAIQPQFDWLREIIDIHQNLFTEIKQAGGTFEFSLMHFVKGSRGAQITLSPENLRTVQILDIEIKVTFVCFPKPANQDQLENSK